MTRPKTDRFDLIPPDAERRLAQLYSRDAALYGPRDWEAGRKLSEFLNDARDALNRLHAGDTSDDFAARAAWAMLGYMHVDGKIRAGVLPVELADLPILPVHAVQVLPPTPPQLPAAEEPPPPPPPQPLSKP